MTEYKESGALVKKIREESLQAGFHPRVLGQIETPKGPVPFLSLSRKIKRRAPRVLIAAGIHGDEPAGPHAVLALLESFPGKWPELSGVQIEIVPLINPSGFDLRQRTNVHGVDLNRMFGAAAPPPEIRLLMNDYRRRQIDLFIDLHEDVDTPGFYLYELAPSEESAFGPQIISDLRKAGHPINDSSVIEGMPASSGLILRTTRHLPRFFRKGAPQGLYLKKLGARRTLTFETPPRLPLEDRVNMHLLSLRTVLTSWSF